MSQDKKTIMGKIGSWFSKMKIRLFSVSKNDNGKKLAVSQVLKAKNASFIPKKEQLAQFPRLLNEKERQFFSLAILVLLVSGSIFGYSLFNLQRSTVPAIGGEYTEGLLGVPQLINPLYSTVSDVDADLVELIFSGLMKFDAVDGLVTDLAESYDISEDGLVYTFILREDAYWHDGARVRAEDVVFTFNAIQNIEYRSPLQVAFSGVRVEMVNEREIKFTLEEAFSPFLSTLTNGILPSHLWQEIQPTNATVAELNRKPVGSGPYKVEKIVRDARGNIRSYSLVRNENYHGKTAFINRLNFRFYPEVISALEAVRNRNVEGLAYIPIDYIGEFRNMNGVKVLQPALQQYTAIFFNQDQNQLLRVPQIRQAINNAINREKLVSEAVFDFARPIDSFLLPGMPGYEEISDDIRRGDPEKAGEILDELEWIMDDETGFRKKGDDILSFTLTVVESPDLTLVADELARQLAGIGIQLNIRKVNSSVFQNEIIREKDYELLLAGSLYGIDPDPYPFWHSSQIGEYGLNLAQFANRQADEKIVNARSSNDEDIRAEALVELRDLINESNPAIFLYQPFYPYVTANKIKGQNVNKIVNPHHRFSTINEWFIRTRRVMSE